MAKGKAIAVSVRGSTCSASANFLAEKCRKKKLLGRCISMHLDRATPRFFCDSTQSAARNLCLNSNLSASLAELSCLQISQGGMIADSWLYNFLEMSAFQEIQGKQALLRRVETLISLLDSSWIRFYASIHQVSERNKNQLVKHKQANNCSTQTGERPSGLVARSNRNYIHQYSRFRRLYKACPHLPHFKLTTFHEVSGGLQRESSDWIWNKHFTGSHARSLQ